MQQRSDMARQWCDLSLPIASDEFGEYRDKLGPVVNVFFRFLSWFLAAGLSSFLWVDLLGSVLVSWAVRVHLGLQISFSQERIPQLVKLPTRILKMYLRYVPESL